MLNIDGEKMSKSLGNVIWAKDYIQELGGNVVRWLLLLAHYRSPLNISAETIQQAQSEVEKIQSVLKQTRLALMDSSIETSTFTSLYDAFLDACKDDMNINLAMSVVFEQVKQLNQLLRSKTSLKEDIVSADHTLRKMMSILGISTPYPQLSTEEVQLIHAWNQAKGDKDFTLADHYRSLLIERGVLS